MVEGVWLKTFASATGNVSLSFSGLAWVSDSVTQSQSWLEEMQIRQCSTLGWKPTHSPYTPSILIYKPLCPKFSRSAHYFLFGAFLVDLFLPFREEQSPHCGFITIMSGRKPTPWTSTWSFTCLFSVPIASTNMCAVYSTIPRPHQAFHTSTPRGRIPWDQNTIQPKTDVDGGKLRILAVAEIVIAIGWF